MKLLQRLAYSLEKGKVPNLKRNNAIARLNQFMTGQDVWVNGRKINLRRDKDGGHITSLFNAEFGQNRKDKELLLAVTCGDKPYYLVADVAHTFIDTGNVPVFIILNLAVYPDGESSKGFCCVFDGYGPNYQFVGVNAESLINFFDFFINSFAKFGLYFPARVRLLMFHDEVMNQLVILELIKRRISPLENNDYNLVKCLVSPDPVYTMLFTLLDMGDEEQKSKLKRELGIESAFELIIAKTAIRDQPEIIYTMHEHILECAERRVSAFLKKNGISKLSDIIPREREIKIRKETIG